jgi:hypothetical protein
VIREEVSEAARRLDAASRVGEESARQALRDHGIEFVTATTSEEVDRWHDISRRALAELRRRQIYSDALIDELQRHLADYRREAAGSRGE